MMMNGNNRSGSWRTDPRPPPLNQGRTIPLQHGIPAMVHQQGAIWPQVPPHRSSNAAAPMRASPVVDVARRGMIRPGSPGSPITNPVSSPSSWSRSSDDGYQNSCGSPAAQYSEDQAYSEKWNQLQDYIEPLQLALIRFKRPGLHPKYMHMVPQLLNFLVHPRRRYPMDTLQRCGEILERMELEPVMLDEAIQLLLGAIDARITTPTFNHTLRRVFEKPITKLLGRACDQNSVSPSSPIPKRRCVSSAEENTYAVPDVLMNEIAHLGPQFKVELDPAQRLGDDTFKLRCHLEERSLPSVPPIVVVVPGDYPENPPRFLVNKFEYTGMKFYIDILETLRMHVDRMSFQYSVTALLEAWETCVRQVVRAKLPDLRSSADDPVEIVTVDCPEIPYGLPRFVNMHAGVSNPVFFLNPQEP